MPAPLEWLRYGDRFGFQVVLGRDPSPGEMRQMIACENVTLAYNSRAQSESWAKWADDNPSMASVLNQALRATNGE